MRVRCWGTRGSLPVALTAADVRQKLLATLRAARGRALASDADLEAVLAGLPFAVAGTYGGHSSCVEIETGGADYVVCDMGSGLRPFGQAATNRRGGVAQTFHIFVSHLHWDHIMGLPFFVPAFIPGNRVVFYGSHANLESALRRQQEQPSFPVDFRIFGATLEFVHLEPGRAVDVAGLRVTSMLQRHGGDSYGYRFEGPGGVVVYSTDSEHPLAQPEHTERFVNFFRNADLVVFDAMYSLADAVSVKADWGHSSNIVGVELCQMAGARHLCLFHHEPVFDDAAIDAVLAETRRLEEITRGAKPLHVSAAFDGMEIEL
ncbi:MAG TPA: MBL fold metallo-hydrolase [Caldimonas sp.]|jgi:phosphoribosyl 1,2-cyclic phosphodiesterase|nr:MBL fold metallo-hydrolase [Caldimonas sp.]HEX4234461.1 MBL fold metallo-hydrolase [Caldimonas sp.]